VAVVPSGYESDVPLEYKEPSDDKWSPDGLQTRYLCLAVPLNERDSFWNELHEETVKGKAKVKLLN